MTQTKSVLSAVPGELPSDYRVGCLIALASNRKLIPRELVVAMSMQPPPTHLSTGMLMCVDKPVEVARELLAEAAVNAHAKYLWFVDDDTIPPPNALRRLHYVLENNPQVMAAGGVYMTKCEPPGPVIFRGMGLGPFWQWKVGDVFEVTGMGAGCMMIKCEVFEKLAKPWFPWVETQSTDPNQPSVTVSEDINFCNAVRAAGYHIVAHGGIICDHYDMATGETFTLPENSYPCLPRIAIAQPDQPGPTQPAGDNKPVKKEGKKKWEHQQLSTSPTSEPVPPPKGRSSPMYKVAQGPKPSTATAPSLAAPQPPLSASTI